MIEYNCKDVIYVLIKKWYILLVVVLITGVMAIPLSEISYKRAVENYNKLVIANGVPQLFNVVTKYEINNQQEKSIPIYIACLKDETLVNELCSKYSVETDWNSIFEQVEYNYLGENVFAISILNAEESEISLLLDVSINYMNQYWIESNLGDMEFRQIEFMKNEVGSDNAVLEELLEKPNKENTNKRIILSAIILGFVFGVFIIMCIDYLEKCRKNVKNEKL